MYKKKQPFVIITVPHASGCDQTVFNHYCDYYGEKVASVLSHAMRDVKVANEIPFVSTIGRRQTDMNRKWSRETEYRLSIDDAIGRAISLRYDVWVIDVHSFPPDYLPFSGSNNPDEQNKFIILDTRIEKPNYVTPYVRDLVHELLDKGIAIETMEGAHPHPNVLDEDTNDIMDSARTMGAKAFLIEANENTSNEVIAQTSKAIATFIKRYNK